MKFQFREYVDDKWRKLTLDPGDELLRIGLPVGNRKHHSHLNIGEETIEVKPYYQDRGKDFWWVLKRVE